MGNCFSDVRGGQEAVGGTQQRPIGGVGDGGGGNNGGHNDDVDHLFGDRGQHALSSQIETSMETGQSPSKANEAMLAAEERESTEGASSTSCSPLRPTGGDSGPFDVFLSFKGSDTRKGFTDHLYHRLDDAGIRVFRDRDSLPKGEDFRSRLLAAITESKISIPVISEKYASSKWCLRELIHIMDCKKKKSHIVLPIFYKVDPSDVRYLKGDFKKAFDLRKHRFDEKLIKEGKEALEDVSYLDGWKSSEFADGYLSFS